MVPVWMLLFIVAGLIFGVTVGAAHNFVALWAGSTLNVVIGRYFFREPISTVWRTLLFGDRDRYHGVSRHTGSILPTTLWGKSPCEVAEESVIRRLQNTSSWTGSEAECRDAVCLAFSKRRCGESPHVKLQRVSSEDHRTPILWTGNEAECRDASALEFFATGQSCREGCQAYKNEVYLLPTELD